MDVSSRGTTNLYHLQGYFLNDVRDAWIAILVYHACPQTFSSTSPVSRWRDPVAPVFAKAYINLALPKSQMISMAKLRPEWTLALRHSAQPMAISVSTSINSEILEIPKLVCLYYDNLSQIIDWGDPVSRLAW